MSELRFDGRVAVITGGGRGLRAQLCAAACLERRQSRRRRSGRQPRGSKASTPVPRKQWRARSGARRRSGRQHCISGNPRGRQRHYSSRVGPLRPDRRPHPQRRQRPRSVLEGNDPGGLRCRARCPPARRISCRAPGLSSDVQGRLRSNRADLVDRRLVRESPRGELRRGEGGADRTIERGRHRRRRRGRQVQCHRSRGRDARWPKGSTSAPTLP